MLKPVFILSLPRSRTAWLAAYLNGLGIRAYHDAWRFVKNVKDMRQLLMHNDVSSKLVVNSDSSNILFYDELRQEFPEATFIKINRNLADVKVSCAASYGNIDETALDIWFSILKKTEADFELDFETWGAKQSFELVRFLTDKWIDPNWHNLAHDLNIKISDERIFSDYVLVSSGAVGHITAKSRG